MAQGAAATFIYATEWRKMCMAWSHYPWGQMLKKRAK